MIFTFTIHKAEEVTPNVKVNLVGDINICAPTLGAALLQLPNYVAYAQENLEVQNV